jgi:hypothetical protein
MLIRSGEWEQGIIELKLVKQWFQAVKLNQTLEQFREFKLRASASSLVLNSHLMDQVEITIDTFKTVKKLDYENFASAGSICERTTSHNHLYMVKKFTQSEIQEFIAAALFKRLLYNRAPIISIVRNHGIASKFFNNGYSLSIDEYASLEYVLTQYKGIELIFAVGMRFGDIDLNTKNLIAHKEETEEGTTRCLRKIDHGWALTTFFTREGEMRKVFFTRFAAYLPFINLHKLKDAILRCCSVSEDEIEDIVKRQIYKLKRQNIKPPFKFYIGIDDELSPNNDSSFYSTVQFLTLDDYEKFILARLKMQRTVLQSMVKSLDIISLIEPHIPKHLRTELLQAIDPCVWAIQNDVPIGGIDAIDYVMQNKLLNDCIAAYCIDAYRDNPTLLRTFLQPDHSIVTDALVIFCLDNDFKLHDKDPIDYAIEYNLITEELARHAAENGLAIGGMDAFEYGIQNNMLFKGIHPIVYALNCDLNINGTHPFIFWDIQKKGHYHRSIFIELITDDIYLGLWDEESYHTKLKEVAKFALYHGLKIYDKPAVEFLDEYAIDLSGLEPKHWANLYAKNTDKRTKSYGIGITVEPF